MGNVVELFKGETADDVLEKAKGKFDRVVMLGERDGCVQICCNQDMELMEAVFWLEKMKVELMMRGSV